MIILGAEFSHSLGHKRPVETVVFQLIRFRYSKNFLPELAGISRRQTNNKRSSHPDWAAATHRSPDNRSRTGMHWSASDPSTDDHIQDMSMLSMVRTISWIHFLAVSGPFGLRFQPVVSVQIPPFKQLDCFDQLRPQRSRSASLTFGETNSDTSPPRDATSRTRLDEMNVYFSVGVRNAVSTSSVKWRFMFAS